MVCVVSSRGCSAPTFYKRECTGWLFGLGFKPWRRMRWMKAIGGGSGGYGHGEKGAKQHELDREACDETHTGDVELS